MMLIGTWRISLERSGRLSLPLPFRPIVADGLTVTRSFDRCLQIFPADAWHTLARRVSALPLTADTARSFRRLIFGAAVDLTLDQAGTITLPRSLLAHAELASQAILVGCEAYIEIWSPERWQALSEGPPPAIERLAGLVASLVTLPTPAAL
ncbi:MAG: division/cell wall cluster transcriptional repressor MraZ [Chloroflexales bacterium]|nr:division/cell wall cluster transcriptional repressor MraZ [Chloroflexales bacterium]